MAIATIVLLTMVIATVGGIMVMGISTAVSDTAMEEHLEGATENHRIQIIQISLILVAFYALSIYNNLGVFYADIPKSRPMIRRLSVLT